MRKTDDGFVRHKIEAIILESPKLHDWGNGPTSGGIEGDILRTLAKYLCDEFGIGNFRSIETGSGLTTVLFAAAEPKSHIAVNYQEAVRERIFAELHKRGLSESLVRYVTDFSENVLPDLAKVETVDLAFIDGGHGWPTVFVDFCYMNMMLRKGGILAIDDVPAFPCGQLFLLLKHQPGWKLESIVYSKTAFFRKETDARLMPDWGGEPYIKANMLFV